jgi:hypothetical protein
MVTSAFQGGVGFRGHRLYMHVASHKSLQHATVIGETVTKSNISVIRPRPCLAPGWRSISDRLLFRLQRFSEMVEESLRQLQSKQ